MEKYFEIARKYYLAESGNKLNLIFDIYMINSGDPVGDTISNGGGVSITNQSFFPNLGDIVSSNSYSLKHSTDAIYQASFNNSDFDILNYDADSNGVADGIILVHEGRESRGSRGVVWQRIIILLIMPIEDIMIIRTFHCRLLILKPMNTSLT